MKYTIELYNKLKVRWDDVPSPEKFTYGFNDSAFLEALLSFKEQNVTYWYNRKSDCYIKVEADEDLDESNLVEISELEYLRGRYSWKK